MTDIQAAELLAALAERNVYSVGDLELHEVPRVTTYLEPSRLLIAVAESPVAQTTWMDVRDNLAAICAEYEKAGME